MPSKFPSKMANNSAIIGHFVIITKLVHAQIKYNLVKVLQVPQLPRAFYNAP